MLDEQSPALFRLFGLGSSLRQHAFQSLDRTILAQNTQNQIKMLGRWHGQIGEVQSIKAASFVLQFIARKQSELPPKRTSSFIIL